MPKSMFGKEPTFIGSQQITTIRDNRFLENAEIGDRDEISARALCECGDYERALGELKREHLYERQKNRVWRKYRATFETIPSFDERFLEMATVLELYDPETWEHSIRVYEIAKEKIENNRQAGHYLREKLDEENSRIDDLFLACLFHDIGKICIPKEVLRSTVTDEEWAMLAFAALDPEEFSIARERIRTIPRMRWKDIAPFSLSVSPHQAEYLKVWGIDPTLPLGFIVDRHTDVSAEILRSYEFDAAAEIARNHHNRPLKEEASPVTLSSFRASWIIRSADIYDALNHSRPYKKRNSLLKTLAVLGHETEDGFIDIELARHWINDDLFRAKLPLEQFLNDPKEGKNAQFLARFLEK